METKETKELERIVANMIDYARGRDMVNEAFAALKELARRAEAKR